MQRDDIKKRVRNETRKIQGIENRKKLERVTVGKSWRVLGLKILKNVLTEHSKY